MAKKIEALLIKKNESGVSLVSTLVSIGIVAIIGLAFTSLMKDMFATSHKVNNLAAAENAVRLVKSIVANPKLCNQAFEGAGNIPILIPAPGAGLTTAAINRIIITDPPAPTTKVQVLAVGDNLTRQLSVNSITFREFTTDASSRGTITADGVAYRTYLGEVVITFGSTEGILGGGIGERRIPVCLAVRNDTSRLAYCCDNLQTKKLCDEVNGNYNEDTNTCDTNANLRGINCATMANPTQCQVQPAGCVPVYFIRGFGANMNPVCDCVMTCDNVGGPPPALPGIPGGPSVGPSGPGGSPAGGPNWGGN